MTFNLQHRRKSATAGRAHGEGTGVPHEVGVAMAGEWLAHTAGSTLWRTTKAAYIRGKIGEAGRLSVDRGEVRGGSREWRVGALYVACRPPSVKFACDQIGKS